MIRKDPIAAAGPLVSILSPSYNQVAWIGDCLRSVACQSYPRIEHIVMDGGSTDGTLQVLEAAGGSVCWRTESDGGQADAINKAFTASRGEIIGWINSDDAYFDCQAVQHAVEFFEAHPEVDIVYGHCAQITADGALIQLLWAPPFTSGLLRALDIISQPTAFIRRRVLTEPMLDVSYHFTLDYELWLRLDAAGARFARMPRIVAVDRHQRGRKSATILDVHESDTRRLEQRYETRFGPEWEHVRTRFYRRQRLMGGLLVPKARPPLAFTHPPDFKRGVVRRQVMSRRSHWPEECR